MVDLSIAHGPKRTTVVQVINGSFGSRIESAGSIIGGTIEVIEYGLVLDCGQGQSVWTEKEDVAMNFA